MGSLRPAHHHQLIARKRLKSARVRGQPQLRRSRRHASSMLWPHGRTMPPCGHAPAEEQPWPPRAAIEPRAPDRGISASFVLKRYNLRRSARPPRAPNPPGAHASGRRQRRARRHTLQSCFSQNFRNLRTISGKLGQYRESSGNIGKLGKYRASSCAARRRRPRPPQARFFWPNWDESTF